MTCNNRTPLLHFPRASCPGSFDSICGWCLFLAHKAQRVYIIDLLYFRFNPLVPLNLNELSQKELTPLLPRHKRDGGFYNPHINFPSASVQHINWKAPNAAAILIFATAKVFASKSLLLAEEQDSEEAQQSNPHSLGTILPAAPCWGPKSFFPPLICFMYFLQLVNKLEGKHMGAGASLYLVVIWRLLTASQCKNQGASAETSRQKVQNQAKEWPWPAAKVDLWKALPCGFVDAQNLQGFKKWLDKSLGETSFKTIKNKSLLPRKSLSHR